MPLPAALAARLAKRGIITGKKNDTKKESKKKVHEEVIAEDYDNAKEEITQIDITQRFLGYIACPNKYNIHHDCTRKCKEIWGKGHIQPTERYLKRQMKIIQRYPLPETWKAIYDPGSGQHYYWDWSSDLVSWLPPGHPKAQISQPASQLREELHVKEAEKDDATSSEESGSDQDDDLSEPESKRERRDSHDKESRDIRTRPINESRHHRNQRALERSNKKDRTLDPMDPASYSDIPRGKWSDGLVRSNEAKTGADTTAAGPLYQMRPYPSPGAVLRSNKSGKDTDKDDEKETGKKVSFPEPSREDRDRDRDRDRERDRDRDRDNDRNNDVEDDDDDEDEDDD